MGILTDFDRHASQVWVFGLIEREMPTDLFRPQKALVFIVNDRKRETLEQIMVSHCSPGTTIYHDGWKAYGAINYGKYEMHHQENLIENNRGDLKRTRLNQCYIESLWGDIKHRCKRIYNTIPGEDGNMESFLYEMMWRRL